MNASTDHNMICGNRDSPQDVALHIKGEHVPHIVSGEKNVEYRDYILDPMVKRVWLFVDEEKTIKYILSIGGHKVPGQVNDPKGLGNDMFDKGLKKSRFGYPILSVHALPRNLSIGELLFGYEMDFVNRGKQYVKQALVDRYPVKGLEMIIPKGDKAESRDTMNDVD